MNAAKSIFLVLMNLMISTSVFANDSGGGVCKREKTLGQFSAVTQKDLKFYKNEKKRVYEISFYVPYTDCYDRFCEYKYASQKESGKLSTAIDPENDSGKIEKILKANTLIEVSEPVHNSYWSSSSFDQTYQVSIKGRKFSLECSEECAKVLGEISGEACTYEVDLF